MNILIIYLIGVVLSFIIVRKLRKLSNGYNDSQFDKWYTLLLAILSFSGLVVGLIVYTGDIEVKFKLPDWL